MAYLDYRTNLQLWLAADAISYLADGDFVATWEDISGNGRNFSGVAPATPIFKLNILNGRPALLFDGADDVLTGPNQSTYLGSLFTMLVVFKATAVTANNATIPNNDGVCVGSVQAGPGILLRNNGPNFIAYNNDGTVDSVSIALQVGDWYVGICQRASGNVVGGLDDPYSMTQTTSGVPANLASAGKIGENWNATAWFTGYIAEILCFNASLVNDDLQHVINYLANKYFSPSLTSAECSIVRGDPVEQARDVASRRLWAFSRPRLKARVTAPLQFADVELLDLVAVSHPQWPHPTGLGAGNDQWERALTRLHETTVDLDTLTVEMVLAEL